MVMISPRGGKWIIGILLVSLGINVFLGGLIVGRMIYGPRFRVADFMQQRQPANAQLGALLSGPIMRIVQSIPDEHRQKFVRAMEAHRTALQSTNQGVREARVRLGEATVAEPFNRASFVAASDQLSTRTQAQRKVFVEAIADGIAELPIDVRRRIVDAAAGAPGAPARRRGQ
jgi:uncharacterized membrane protein